MVGVEAGGPGGDEVQSRLLEESLAVVRSSTLQMRRCLDAYKLMDGLKCATTMLSELRTSALDPKHYYELYLANVDALRHLSTYLHNEHISGRHHLADIYELVQYAGNIVPRLYLMITVGSAYMGITDSPIPEIMRDLIEMNRGIQHPVRGLFLRHYLSAQVREHLPQGDSSGSAGTLNDSVSFILTNFIEMNKLWVRLQHQGHSREKEKRTQERRDLQILIGTNLVRLSELDGIDLQLYSERILPAILEQVVQCRDALAQECLMEVITQVFTDEFHLRTLEQFLAVIPKLHPNVNVQQIITALIDRLAFYAARSLDNEDSEVRKAKEEEISRKLSRKIQQMKIERENERDTEAKMKDETQEITNADSQGIVSQYNGVGDDFKPFEVDWSENVEVTDSSVQQFGHLSQNKDDDHENDPPVSLGIPEDVKLFDIFWSQVMNIIKCRADISIENIFALQISLCNLATHCYIDRLEYVDKIFEYSLAKSKEFAGTAALYSVQTQQNIMILLLAPLSSYQNFLTVLALPNYLKCLQMQTYSTRRSVAEAVCHSIFNNSITIDQLSDVDGVMQLVESIIKEGEPTPNRTGSAIISDNFSGTSHVAAIEEQTWLARLMHYFQNDDLDVQFQIIQLCMKRLSLGGCRIVYTYPALVTQSIKLVRQYRLRHHDWKDKCKKVYALINDVISNLHVSLTSYNLALRLYCFAGQIADQNEDEDSAYEFFAQAYSIYEEYISESSAQFEALMIIANSLHQTRNFTVDNYDTLINKTAKHGNKLLQKPAQCRAVYSASHLWWDVELPTRKEEDERTLYHDGKRVLECLQKALKIADACMDSRTTIVLFVEILNRYLYFRDKENEAITPKFITGLTDLIQSNISNLDLSQPHMSSKSAMSAGAIYEPEEDINAYITAHFERTLESMNRREH